MPVRRNYTGLRTDTDGGFHASQTRLWCTVVYFCMSTVRMLTRIGTAAARLMLLSSCFPDGPGFALASNLI